MSRARSASSGGTSGFLLKDFFELGKTVDNEYDAIVGNCKYCGKPAGFLRFKHDECEKEHQHREQVIQDGKQRISVEVTQAIKGSGNFDDLEKTISEIARSSLPNPVEITG